MLDRVYIDSSVPQWKANLHAHSTRSDGQLTPEGVAQLFKQAGYDCILMSDHERYWDSSHLDAKGFLILSGAECSVAHNASGLYPLGGKACRSVHLLILQDEAERARLTPYQHDERIPPPMDTGIASWNACIRQHARRGNLVVLCHPRWSRIEPELMLSIEGCAALEVYNHTSETVETCGESEYEWDYCLRRGKRFLAVATDDCHSYAPEANQACGGFTMICAPHLTRPDVTQALLAGNCYASCGPRIHDMRVQGGVLSMRFSPAQAVRLVAAPAYAPTLFARPASEAITEIAWPIRDDLVYVRPEVVDSTGRKAWGQPVFLSDLQE